MDLNVNGNVKLELTASEELKTFLQALMTSAAAPSEGEGPAKKTTKPRTRKAKADTATEGVTAVAETPAATVAPVAETPVAQAQPAPVTSAPAPAEVQQAPWQPQVAPAPQAAPVEAAPTVYDTKTLQDAAYELFQIFTDLGKAEDFAGNTQQGTLLKGYAHGIMVCMQNDCGVNDIAAIPVELQPVFVNRLRQTAAALPPDKMTDKIRKVL